MNTKTEHMQWKNRIFPLIGAVIVIVLCFTVLYGGENVGLSDNGDFRRVLLTNNLEYKNETDYYYLFKQDYIMKIEGDTFTEMIKSAWSTNNQSEIYSTPHFVLIKLSKVMNLAANYITGNDVTKYNIIWLAGIYIFLLAAAAWCIFTFFTDQKLSMRITVFVLFILIFCDEGYILYFNSLYGEPLQYVSVMLMIGIGLMLYKRPSIPKVCCFFLALYFFSGAKVVNICYAAIVSLLAITMVFLRSDKLFRTGVIVSAVVSIIFMGSLYAKIPEWMQLDTTYQSVFFGLTKGSDDPAKDLKELGVDEKYAVLVNTHAYMEDAEYPIDVSTYQFRNEFYNHVSKVGILFFYLKHPIRLLHKLSLSIESSAYIRPPNVGNSSTKIMEMSGKYSLWSNLRILLKFMYQPSVVMIIMLLLTLYVVFVNIFVIRNRKKGNIHKRIYMICAFDVLLIGLWLNLILPIVCNGEADLAKHMFLFVNYIDILFAIWIIGLLTMKRENAIIPITIAVCLTIVFYISPSKKTMDFGTYNGKPIKWEVVDELNDGTTILITKDCISDRRFDGISNMWETSELRYWLQNDFLAEFTDAEKSKIVPVTNEVILAGDNKDFAVAGDHAHYWNFTKNRVGDLSKTAYHYYLEDSVYIPTLDMLERIGTRDSYWVLCPYAGNDKMERYMKYDGYILHTSVDNTKGVRAVIKYNNMN